MILKWLKQRLESLIGLSDDLIIPGLSANKTGFVFDDSFKLHQTRSEHPERPERMTAIYSGIRDAGLLPKLELIKPVTAELEWIKTVHDEKYIERILHASKTGETELDNPDNHVCSNTYDIALLAVGGVLAGIDHVMTGKVDNVFCAVRPPGHHAEFDKAMGFCFFANVAIGAKYLQKKYKIKRVGIIDIDVHHGNGTQNAFQYDSSVFYYSIHEHPSFAFPGTGREFEEGAGSGLGYTKNTPVLPNMGDDDYMRLLESDLVPAFDLFRPDVILVSAGFDAHVDDEMSDMRLTTRGDSEVMRKITALADKYCNGRIISVLEGGYCLGRLPELAQKHIKVLMNL